jgi:hypothetical protein
MDNLEHFMSESQRKCLQDFCAGEEGEYFKQLLLKLNSHIVCMPKNYETDGQGDQAIVSLHYFVGGSDWWITERDMELREQKQAFGYACLNGDVEMAELGYINIEELIRHGVELDLYFEPMTLGQVQANLHKKRG